jgi:choline kinase
LRAVILAAGSSTRLYPLTKETPKCLLEVGGKTLIEHQLGALDDVRVSEAIVVTGYLSHMLEAKLDSLRARYGFKISLADNPRYAETNNVYSLWVAKDRLAGGPFLCLHADVLFHPRILRAAAASPEEVCLVADREVLEETMKLKVDGPRVTAVGKHVSMEEASGTFLGLAKFSESGGGLMMAEVERVIEAGQTGAYFTSAVERLIGDGARVGVCYTEGLPWIEIDFPDELERARSRVYPRISAAGA